LLFQGKYVEENVEQTVFRSRINHISPVALVDFCIFDHIEVYNARTRQGTIKKYVLD